MNIRLVLLLASALVFGVLAAVPGHAVDLEHRVKFDIPAQQLSSALIEFSRQARLQVVSADALEGLQTAGVSGSHPIREALIKLLDASGLNYRVVSDTSITVGKREPSGAQLQSSEVRLRLARAAAGDGADTRAVSGGEEARHAAGDKSDGVTQKGVPEILVKGRKSLNMDIRRTEDAPQPYVVFEREEIQRSQAINLQEFFKSHLTSNATQASTYTRLGATPYTYSGINLRGLGENQTLVLIDGRRLPSTDRTNAVGQPDLNGIPLAAIERIEVLPSTASGIYGGGATGGVVNVILRRDYTGFEVTASYATPFDTDAATRRVDISGGFSLEQGRTRVTLAGSYAKSNDLTAGDRDDLIERAAAVGRRNDPAGLEGLTSPPFGATPNIRGVGGALLTLKPEYGGTALGSAFTYVPEGYAGAASDNGAALRANAGDYNLAMGLNSRQVPLISTPAQESFTLNVRREFGARVEAFVDVSVLDNRGSDFDSLAPSTATVLASAPNNPFEQDISVAFPTRGFTAESLFKSETRRATAGLIARLPREWTGTVEYGRSQSDSAQSYTSTFFFYGFFDDALLNCMMSRGVASNVDPDGAGPLTPCDAGQALPALNVLQDGGTDPLDFTPYVKAPMPNLIFGNSVRLTNATLRLSGPVAELPGGALRLTAMAERREENNLSAYDETRTSADTSDWQYRFPRSGQTSSYYLEAHVPLVSARNARPFAQALELQASIRRDEYRTLGLPLASTAVASPDIVPPSADFQVNEVSSDDYTLALRFAPSEDIAVRASHGTGFLPPSIYQIASRSQTLTRASILNIFGAGTDPKRGSTDTYVGLPIEWVRGGSPALEPETSTSTSLGVIFTPRFAPGLRVSIDYTRIKKADEIQLLNLGELLLNEDSLPGRIVRGDNLPGDQPGWAGPVIRMDQTLLNVADSQVQAYDLRADYTLDTGLGALHWYAAVTRQKEYKSRLHSGNPYTEETGFTRGPLQWRGNLGLDWTRGAWTLGWNTQYFDSYLVYEALPVPLTPGQIQQREALVREQGSDTIPSQIYHDLIGAYRFGADAPYARGLLANSEIIFGIQNVLDTAPPIVVRGAFSVFGDIRLRRYTVSFRKSFQ